MKFFRLEKIGKSLFKIIAIVGVLAISLALVKLYTPQNILQTYSKTAVLPTVVIDAGHAALKNTID